MELTYEQKLVWLAALIDGEGHVSASCFKCRTDKNGKVFRRFKAYVGLTNTNVKLIEFAALIMKEIAGVKPVIHFDCSPSRPVHHKPVYRMHFGSFEPVHVTLLAIRPYLIAKGEQADSVLAMIKHRRNVVSSVGKKSPEASVEVDAWLQRELGQLHNLNKRGLKTTEFMRKLNA